jgi:hypothetical protein
MNESKGVKKRTLVLVYTDCVQRGDFRFNNALVKKLTGDEFSNQFDTTKIDRSEILPTELKEKDLFIVHLGKGWHQFVKGIRLGYHELEQVPEGRIRDWEYYPGILDDTDMSEASVLSTAFNQGILQQFLFGDRRVQAYINVPRRTRGKDTNSFDYRIGEQLVRVEGLQIEMDFIIERGNEITLVEAKSSVGELPKDFAVGQVYLPYRRLIKVLEDKHKKARVRSLFLVQYKRDDGRTAMRVYEYTFDDPQDMGSLRFVSNAEFALKES